MCFLDFWSFETFKSQENIRKITIYVKSIVFFPFWESSGLEMAGWLAGLGAGQAGWAGRQAGWSWQADLDVGPDLKLHGWCWQEAGWAGRQACQTAY